ncbi:hypothetical protein R1sor_012361 [Riccia sorocarpa]|uniref:Uncharacterized protein n=1 Tax=Riccia sorocarpa TaxID=122646 RepID=A0ABD3I7C2_9MARC
MTDCGQRYPFAVETRESGVKPRSFKDGTLKVKIFSDFEWALAIAIVKPEDTLEKLPALGPCDRLFFSAGQKEADAVARRGTAFPSI